MKKSLSRVYLDDFPVRLLEDEERPTLARIVLAGGKNPGRVAVVALASRFGEHGEPMDAYEVIDRAAEPTRPIYLRSVPKHGGAIDAPASKDPAPTTQSPSRQSDPVIDQLGGPLPARTSAARPRRAEALAQAEAEAEQRQEEQRDQEDALQDEQEALQESDDDRDMQT